MIVLMLVVAFWVGLFTGQAYPRNVNNPAPYLILGLAMIIAVGLIIHIMMICVRAIA